MHPTPSPLRWGILGTGTIAHTFARGVRGSRLGTLAAVGSRSAESANKFAAELGGTLRSHASYDALLADAEVEAVYIATPHPQHLEWALRAIGAGKHVLCEKPLTLTRRDAALVVDAARAAGVTLMEAYMYRCHPQTARIADLIGAGAVGRVGLIEATFGFHFPFTPGHRLYSRELAGGGILDVGGYPVSLARLIAGAAVGKPFADPVAVHGAGLRHPETGVDVHAAATLEFPGGLAAQVACGVGLELPNTVTIFGTEGRLHVPAPWFPGRGESRRNTLDLRRRDGAPPSAFAPHETIAVESDRELYAYEADAFATAVRTGEREVSAMSWEDSLGNLAVMDRWREQVSKDGSDRKDRRD